MCRIFSLSLLSWFSAVVVFSVGSGSFLRLLLYFGAVCSCVLADFALGLLPFAVSKNLMY